MTETDQSAPPNVLRETVFTLQVCVPKSMTDDEVEQHFERVRPAGTAHGWRISANAEPRCAQCLQYAGNVHFVLEA